MKKTRNKSTMRINTNYRFWLENGGKYNPPNFFICQCMNGQNDFPKQKKGQRWSWIRIDSSVMRSYDK